MEVVKLVESQRPTTLSTALSDPAFEKLDTDLRIAELIAAPQRARPTREYGKYGRPQRSLPLRQSAHIQTLLR